MVRVEVVLKTGEGHLKAGEKDPAKEGEAEEAFEKVEVFERAAGVARGSSNGEAAVIRG